MQQQPLETDPAAPLHMSNFINQNECGSDNYFKRYKIMLLSAYNLTVWLEIIATCLGTPPHRACSLASHCTSTVQFHILAISHALAGCCAFLLLLLLLVISFAKRATKRCAFASYHPYAPFAVHLQFFFVVVVMVACSTASYFILHAKFAQKAI